MENVPALSAEDVRLQLEAQRLAQEYRIATHFLGQVRHLLDNGYELIIHRPSELDPRAEVIVRRLGWPADTYIVKSGDPDVTTALENAVTYIEGGE